MEKKSYDGAAWKKAVKTKNGTVEVLSITIGDKRYTAWPNTYKKDGDKTPDYRLLIDNYEPNGRQGYQSPRKDAAIKTNTQPSGGNSQKWQHEDENMELPF